MRCSLKLVPAVPEHDPLLRLRRAARSVRHEPLAGRPARFAGRGRLGERLGGLAEELATPQSDQRLERAPEVAVDYHADDRVDEAAGEQNEATEMKTRPLAKARYRTAKLTA